MAGSPWLAGCCTGVVNSPVSNAFVARFATDGGCGWNACKNRTAEIRK